MTGPARREHALSRGWVFVAVTTILLATLPPQPDWPRSHTQFFTSLLPGSSGGWFDVAQNIALYAPLGFLLAARGRGARLAWATAAALSLLTELLQFVIPGRSPALRDVVVNTVGAVVGYLTWGTASGGALEHTLRHVEHCGGRARRPDQRLASILCLLWSGVVAGVVAATGLLLTPAPPAHGYWVASPYIDVNTRPLYVGSSGPGEGYFRGLIDEVRLFARALPQDRIREHVLRAANTPASADEGVAAVFGFDTDAGAVAHDDTGRGRNGIVQNAAWVPHGRIGGALSFDGTSSQVLVPHHDSLDLRDAMTIEAWVYPERTSTSEPSIVSREGSLYYLTESSSQGPFKAAGGGRFGGVPRYAILGDPIEQRRWTHLAVTYDGQVLRLYKDGVLAGAQVHWSPHRTERVQLNGITLPAGAVRAATSIRSVLRGNIAADVSVRCGKIGDVEAPVFLIEGIQDTEVFALDAAQEELRVRTWTWARRLNLASPPARVPNAFTHCAPGTLAAFTVTGRISDPVVTRDGRPLPVVSAGLGSAWAFVWHAELAPIWLQLGLSFAWLAFLGLPLGYWSRSVTAGTAAVAVVVAACVVVPYACHVRGLNGIEWAGLVAGGAFGLLYRIILHSSAS